MGRGSRVGGFKRLVRVRRRRKARRRTLNVGAAIPVSPRLLTMASGAGVDGSLSSPRKRGSSGRIRRIFRRGLVRFAGDYAEVGKLVPVLMAGVPIGSSNSAAGMSDGNRRLMEEYLRSGVLEPSDMSSLADHLKTHFVLPNKQVGSGDASQEVSVLCNELVKWADSLWPDLRSVNDYRSRILSAYYYLHFVGFASRTRHDEARLRDELRRVFVSGLSKHSIESIIDVYDANTQYTLLELEERLGPGSEWLFQIFAEYQNANYPADSNGVSASEGRRIREGSKIGIQAMEDPHRPDEVVRVDIPAIGSEGHGRKAGVYPAAKPGTGFEFPDRPPPQGTPYLVVDGKGYCIGEFYPEVVIGRNPALDVVLIAQAVSRRHAEIKMDRVGGYYTIEDMGSSNGTYVVRGGGKSDIKARSGTVAMAVGDGIEISANDGPVAIFPGDMIRLGNYEMIFDCVSEGEKRRWEEYSYDGNIKIGFGDGSKTRAKEAAEMAAGIQTYFIPEALRGLNEIKVGMRQRQMGLTKNLVLTTDRREIATKPFGSVSYNPIKNTARLEHYRDSMADVRVNHMPLRKGHAVFLVDGSRVVINGRVFFFYSGAMSAKLTTRKRKIR